MPVIILIERLLNHDVNVIANRLNKTMDKISELQTKVGCNTEFVCKK